MPRQKTSPALPRLVFLIRDLGFGGAQRQLVTLATGLHGRHFDVHVLHFHPGPLERTLEEAGVPHLQVEKKGRWDLLRFRQRLGQVLADLQPDLLHGYLTESNVMITLCRRAAGSPPLIWGLRDSESDAHQWGLLGRASAALAGTLSGRAHALIANSEAGRRAYLDRGYPASRFHVIPNGIDTERFRPSDSTPLREEWKVQDNQRVIGIVGRLNPMKDHPTLFQALTQLGEERRRLRCVVIGDGDETYTTQLQSQVRELDLDDTVHFTPARADLESVYPSLDALVSASAYGEGFSNVIGEAMACGLPCIATDVGDAGSLVAETGWISPRRDPATLAEHLHSFLALSDRELTQRGREARQRVEDHFTIPHLIQRTEACLTALLPANA